ncbi:sodium/calcium exchanger protein-like protein [Phyllosticta capitalensis]
MAETPHAALLRRPHAQRRKPRHSPRPFLATLLLVSLIAVASLLLDTRRATGAPSDVSQLPFTNIHSQCRLVNNAVDKCAFVRQHCPDEEAGIFSYLQLYYCRLPHAKPVAFAIIVLWLALLFSTIGIAASDFFCVNLSTISTLLGMSESMAGVTFLAFGNGSPDVFSTFAAMNTNSGTLAIGELIGAAGFITAVVAGSMALVRPFKVDKRTFVRDVGFFIVAASFSMVFLIDGKLSLWECIAMVVFYIFYVLFVLWWHWWHGRRQRRRLVEATARGHFVSPGGEVAEVFSPCHQQDGRSRSSSYFSHNVSTEDFATLEQGNVKDEPGLETADEEERERWLGELNRNMRLSRPRLGDRRTSKNPPIRPSLVGALEFRAVLSSLQKSRNIQTRPINLRRYSDDPNFTTAQQQDQLSVYSDPAARPQFDDTHSHTSDESRPPTRQSADLRGAGSRTRAVSVNDADSLRFDPKAWSKKSRNIDLLGPLAEDTDHLHVPQPGRPRNSSTSTTASSNIIPSPAISLSPPTSQPASREPSPAPKGRRTRSPNRLAPPERHAQGGGSPSISALRHSPKSTPQSLPKLMIPPSGGEGSKSPFPVYQEYAVSPQGGSKPLSFASPSISPLSSIFPNEHFPEVEEEEEEKPIPWWPGKILPTPRQLVSKLFPTLYNWKKKSHWERFLGFVSAPSVFLLTITLPVVEADKDVEDEDEPEFALPSPVSPFARPSAPSTITVTGPDDVPAGEPAGPSGGQSRNNGNDGVVGQERYRDEPPLLLLSPSDGPMAQSPEPMPHPHKLPAPEKPWDRWLVILQIFTAPFFVSLIVWANTDPSNPRALLLPTLISLACSLAVLALLLGTTTPLRPPRWHTMLCFLGFVVSIAWISTIANEVVGVLKTLGVILDISDAILGLTIFAVGNSMGDLVADITVARLGFPVMALSACFGGPMLNILLGIGLSGCYMTIKKAERSHDKHPDHPVKFKPYHLDVDSTLVISGATLLVTLLGLLALVSMRKWRMDRLVGSCLVVLWVLSTAGNLVAEITGFRSDLSDGSW